MQNAICDAQSLSVLSTHQQACLHVAGDSFVDGALPGAGTYSKRVHVRGLELMPGTYETGNEPLHMINSLKRLTAFISAADYLHS